MAASSGPSDALSQSIIARCRALRMPGDRIIVEAF